MFSSSKDFDVATVIDCIYNGKKLHTLCWSTGSRLGGNDISVDVKVQKNESYVVIIERATEYIGSKSYHFYCYDDQWACTADTLAAVDAFSYRLKCLFQQILPLEEMQIMPDGYEDDYLNGGREGVYTAKLTQGKES